MWVNRIASLEVHNATALPTPPPGTIEAPWRFLGTWEGFMMVRFAAQSSQPECYAVNGVNCLLGETVDDLLPQLTAYESNRTSGLSDATLSIFPAPCGPARQEHWGSDGYSVANDWCLQAARRLPIFEARGSPAHCIMQPSGYVAVWTRGNSSANCVANIKNIGWNDCRIFSHWGTCTASAERFLEGRSSSADWPTYGQSSCGSLETSCGLRQTTSGPTYYTLDGQLSDSGMLSILLGLFGFGVVGAGVSLYMWKKNNEVEARRQNIEATVCSSKDGDEDSGVYRASNDVHDDDRGPEPH
ncbi:hypothetical protein SPRG_18475 [Saprolegnia parasitica CBS 223.65]|uniref:Uncharacterized protein n=1 Tax=Saprolegnia parasitica (strain CBS 223.65) TaxID=695850 RepID=A0A067BCY6_SAPPC|nr:hypothetical protein SPRG_18475 [Saprolegnia parasitica CBS 223.65]KDO15988.1 hypothetical protein SPRG_18475 [Saprolegnia parasitica CBS 223.65]|eukprot:XP_012213304.1 hypothetical protein SPRG_18475 [Saprolegnia parasitica CBS 223.65]